MADSKARSQWTAPTIDGIRQAAARIAPHVHRTPILRCATLDRELGATVYWKAENLQKVGAFKARGALNAVLSLDSAAAARGVLTHSSGNHGAALAYAAAIRSIPCVVVMPDSAPSVKVAAVRGYGAEVVPCPAAERDATCSRLQRERDLTVIHPFEDPAVIAGAGTVALELLAETGPLDLLVVPIGGGGLAAGTALTAAGVCPGAAVLLAEPLAVDDAARSFTTGIRQPRVDGATTWCDGLMTGIGAPNFAVLQSTGATVQTVTEAATLAAARDLMERMKVVVEPSAATVLAALRARDVAGLRIGAVISGGNTDFRWLSP